MRITLVEHDLPTTTISLAAPLEPAPSQAELEALDFAAAYLSRRLYHDFAGARSLNAADSACAPRLAPPVLQLSLGPVDRDNALFALRLALYDFGRFVREGVTLEEFEATRPALGESAGKVTLERVNAAIRAHLDPGAVHVLIETRGAAVLRDEILVGAPSPAVYSSSLPVDVREEDMLIERYPVPVGQAELEIVPAEAAPP